MIMLAALSFCAASLCMVTMLLSLCRFYVSPCTKQESVIWFLWSQEISEAAIHQILSAQHGNNVLLERSAYKWIEKLKNGHKSEQRRSWMPIHGHK
jgi:steroid 5-alpha reductase family enzyme